MDSSNNTPEKPHSSKKAYLGMIPKKRYITSKTQNVVGDASLTCVKKQKLSAVQNENAKPILSNALSNAVPVTETIPHSTATEGVIELLKEILRKQNKIVQNQSKIEERIKSIKDASSENMIEMIAQNRMIRECKVINRKVQQSICRMTGKIVDETMVEISSTLPLATIDAALSLEEKLKEKAYATSMVSYLYKLKGTSDDVNIAIRQIFTDEFLHHYNWDGRWEKKSLAQLRLVDQFLSDVFKEKGRHKFEQEVRKAVELSHNRFKHKKRLQQKNDAKKTII